MATSLSFHYIEGLPLEQGALALRYYNVEEHADCVLVLQPRGQSLFACAAYLTLRSDLFKAMLTHGNFSESTIRVMNITMPCPARADTALRFLYTGQLLHSLPVPRLDPADIFGLLENAQYLQSHELTVATLDMLRLCLRNEAAPFYMRILTDPRFGPDLVPLEWIVGFVRCTPDRSTTDRVRAALAWTRGADLHDPAMLEVLAALRIALDTCIAATSPGEVGALIRECGPALVPLVSADAALVPVLERAFTHNVRRPGAPWGAAVRPEPGTTRAGLHGVADGLPPVRALPRARAHVFVRGLELHADIPPEPLL